MIYDNVRAICDKKKLSFNDLEELAGIGHGTIGKWKFTSPRVETVQKVADALKVPITALLKTG